MTNLINMIPDEILKYYHDIGIDLYQYQVNNLIDDCVLDYHEDKFLQNSF